LGFPLAFDEFFSAAPEFWLFSAEFVDFVSPLDCFFFGVISSPLVLSSFDEFFPADFFLLLKGFFLLLVFDLPFSECSAFPFSLSWSPFSSLSWTILRELQFKEQKAGKIVQLKDENGDQDNENGNAEHSENGKSKTKSKKKPFNNKKKSAGKNSSNDDKTSGDEITPKKKQSNGDTKSTNSAEKSQNSGAAEKNSSNANGKPKKQKQYPATVSVFVGKIPRGTRVKELKEVIIAKGVKPINILWKGGKGYALIYCEKKDVPTSDELFEKLENLTIGDNVLNVEPDKRIKPAAKDGETTTKIIDKAIETVVGSESKNKTPAVDVEAAKQI
jgi:hypothetical protein